LKPPPVVASEEIESSVLTLSCSKRTSREDAGGDLDRAEEESRVPQAEASEVGGGTVELDRQETATADVTADAVAMAEAGLARDEEAITTEVVMSHPATDEVATGEVTIVNASSDPASQEDPCVVAGETAKEASVGVRASEPSEAVVRVSSDPQPTSGAEADMPTPRTEIGTTPGPLLFGATFGSEEVPQGAHTTRMVEGDLSEASPTPVAAAKDTFGGKVRATSTRSGASSQSSASQLQKEWEDTTSSAGSGGGRKALGNNLTLTEVSRQLSAIEVSLGNASLQFAKAAKTINVSNVFLASDLFYQLGDGSGRFMTDFSPH
jgi:hypothetical protein